MKNYHPVPLAPIELFSSTIISQKIVKSTEERKKLRLIAPVGTGEYEAGSSSDESVPATPLPPDYQEFPIEREIRPAEPAPEPESEREPLVKRLRLDSHLERLRRNGESVAKRHFQGIERQHHAPPEEELEFVDDGDVSDIEEKDPNSDTNNPDDAYEARDPQSSEPDDFAKTFNNSIQNFYSQVLGWPVVPSDPSYGNARYTQGQDLLFGNQEWLRNFVHEYGGGILKDVTTAYSMERYRDHWKTILAMEVRGAVAENVSRRFPNLQKNPTDSWTKDIRREEFLDIFVNKVSHTRFLTNLSCTCGDHNLTRRIVDEMRGGSLCLGYAKTEKGFSELSIIACRRICYDKDDVLPDARGQVIRQIDLSIAVSKERFRDAKLGPGSRLKMLHLMHFSTFLRTFKALEECFLIPDSLHTRFYGRGSAVELPFANMEAMEKTVDPESLRYLKNVKASTNAIDDSQYDAIVKVFSNLGSMSEKSSSLSLIQGPPGTGKTQTICNIIGAALHHSKAGHVGKTQVNHLKDLVKDDKIVRASTSFEGLRILVACPSNEAVDNVLRRIKTHGIPDGKGGTFQPQCVRIARDDYDYKDLEEFSINTKALPIDIYWLNRDDPHRRRASSAARKALGKECMVVLSTIATSGGVRLKELKIDIDLVIIDEAAQTLEPEVLMPIVASCKRTRKHRCHVVQVGDHKQLRRMSNALHMVKSVNFPLHFSYSKQMMSQFERLFEKSRCTISILRKQYRMHPDIARLHSQNFYNSIVESPLPAEKFLARYNKGWVNDEGGFAPFTIIDTSRLEERYEFEAGPGQYTNLVEIHIVSETLEQLKRVCGSPDVLRDNISIIAPYRYAVEEMDRILHAPSFALHDPRYRKLSVQTVDSMQGREKEIVIFAATRSNRTREIGFLENRNRLNVALSRAKNLLIIIGDMSTLCSADTNIFKTFFDHCLKKTSGCQLLSRVERKHGQMSGYAELVKAE